MLQLPKMQRHSRLQFVSHVTASHVKAVAVALDGATLSNNGVM